jgi:hypothetical protein
MKWLKRFKYDPLESLLSCGYDNIVYFTKRDLLEEKVGDIRNQLWEMKGSLSILGHQKPDGRWKYPNPKERIRKKEHFDLLETYRQLGFLIEHYGFDKRHEAIKKAQEFVFNYQTKKGDIRGIYANQYSPNYSAGFFELLIKAGYQDDSRVLKGLKWLLLARQDDGGWVLPMRTAKKRLSDIMNYGQAIEADRSMRSSYMVTGIVLRAFAYHPDYRDREEIRKAAELVLSRLFKNDFYPDRGSAEYWTSFSFPFWFTDLIAVLDPIAHLGFKSGHPKVAEGLRWFVDNQRRDGTWNLRLLKGEKFEQPCWMNLNICKLFKKYYS